ncbi:MAG: hypothetical protein WC683_17460 [bacterium]
MLNFIKKVVMRVDNNPTNSKPPAPANPQAQQAPPVAEKPLADQVRDAIARTRTLLNDLNALERKCMRPGK